MQATRPDAERPVRRVRTGSSALGAPLRAHLPQGAREASVAAAVGLGAAIVVALWWHDTPAGSLGHWAERVTAAGRVTGLVGGYLIVVEVVLLARVTWLDRLIGMDRLAVWHRRNGEYSVGLLVAHATFIIWGYALADHVGPLSETRSVVLSYPDVLAATVGLFVLVGVGAVSARAARRRLSYETWYFLHLYTYLAIALSFAHVLATGDDFATHPLNRAFWVALYAGATALVLAYRVGVPVRDALCHRLRVAVVRPEAPGVVSVYVTGRRLSELRAEAGQFFIWRFLTRNGWWQAHPWSLSSAPNSQWLRLTVKGLGDHSCELAALRPGTRVITEGPFGAFTGSRRSRRRVLLVAGGIGVTPLRALIESLPAGPGDLTLLYRASSPQDIVFGHELDAIAQARGATVEYLLGPRDQYPSPLAPERLHWLVPDAADRDVYLCGPPGMTAATRKALRAIGVPSRRIHVEGFEY